MDFFLISLTEVSFKQWCHVQCFTIPMMWWSSDDKLHASFHFFCVNDSWIVKLWWTLDCHSQSSFLSHSWHNSDLTILTVKGHCLRNYILFTLYKRRQLKINLYVYEKQICFALKKLEIAPKNIFTTKRKSALLLLLHHNLKRKRKWMSLLVTARV